MVRADLCLAKTSSALLRRPLSAGIGNEGNRYGTSVHEPEHASDQCYEHAQVSAKFAQAGRSACGGTWLSRLWVMP